MPTTPGGIWTPDDNDDWDLIVDLAAMAVSIDDAINSKPENYVIGTNTQRLALSGADLFPGLRFYATDTRVEWVYESGSWRISGGLRRATISLISGFTAYSGANYLVAEGEVVTMRIAAAGSIPTGGYTEVATVPAGFRPSSTVYAGAMGSSGHAMGVQVTSGGSVQFGNMSGSNRAWAGAQVSFRLGEA